MSSLPRITFVLPGDNRSGGVRVTVAMGNALIARGHSVRLAYHRGNRFSAGSIKKLILSISQAGFGKMVTGWVHEFHGPAEPFSVLEELNFQPGEVAIAVGSLTIAAVYNLKRDVIKVRYSHGLLLESDAEKALWALPMPTIAVASTLIPDLEKLSGDKIRAVVPNGIDLDSYFVENDGARDGLGVIYGEHPAKGPQDIVAILSGLHRELPSVPQYVFGTGKCPAALAHTHYHRFPSVAEARKIYNRCKVWLVPSRTEGFSMPILEAMACGCAVVSTDTYGGRELIRHGENGMLVRCGDVEGLVRQAKQVLEDDSLRNRLVAAGNKTARQFTWPPAAEKMEKFLAGITNRAGANRAAEIAKVA